MDLGFPSFSGDRQGVGYLGIFFSNFMKTNSIIMRSSIRRPLLLFFISLFFIACSDDDDLDNGGTNNNNSSVATCNDGIQNQGEEGIDCGGPCPPCATNSFQFEFKVDNTEKSVTTLNAYRTTDTNPRSLTIIATTNDGEKMTIFLEEPDIVGWSGGLSLFELNSPDLISFELGNGTIYSTLNGNGSEALSFLFLEYEKGGRIRGSFSADLEDGNGNAINISDGSFDSTFDD